MEYRKGVFVVIEKQVVIAEWRQGQSYLTKVIEILEYGCLERIRALERCLLEIQPSTLQQFERTTMQTAKELKFVCQCYPETIWLILMTVQYFKIQRQIEIFITREGIKIPNCLTMKCLKICFDLAKSNAVRNILRQKKGCYKVLY